MLKDNVPVNAPLDFIKAQKLTEVENLSKAMTEIHAQVAEKATRDRKAAIQKHNDKTHVRSPNFQVGDFVLVAEHRKSGVSKLDERAQGLHVFCRPDQCSLTSSYVDNNSSLISE
jgi:hypothetical protein